MDNQIAEVLDALGISEKNFAASTGLNDLDGTGAMIDSYSPVDGALIASVGVCSEGQWEEVMQRASSAFVEWRKWPAPKRGEVVRQIGDALREKKEPLGKLVSYEGPESAGRFGRGSGNDRHLRFCSGSVSAALWTYHALGKATAPHVRAVPSIRHRWHHIGFQFSGGRLELEFHVGVGLW